MRKLVPVALVVMCILGCAALQVPQTSEGKYLLARTEFNNMIQDYIYYKEMLPLEKQTEMSAIFKPYFVQTDAILDEWGRLLMMGESGQTQEQIWLQRKRALMTLLVQHGVVEVK